jgi:chlorite dismutase
MALSPELRSLRQLQSALQGAGLDVVDSYFSITEVSEYARGMPAEMLQARLYPKLPPEGLNAFCFYPMSKKREAHANWYATPYDHRHHMMIEHGKSGRAFAGKVVQLVTGSTGLDDYEWGVTLFAAHPDDLKDVVYTMRFDEASAIYAEFGRFFVGMVCPVDELVDRLGLT